MSGEESSEEDNESSKEKGKKNDSCSTLTSEEESEAKQGPKPASKLLRPIPSLIDDTTLLSTSSAAFDLEDPLGFKAMKAALATTTRSKGTKKTKGNYTLKEVGFRDQASQRECTPEAKGVHSKWLL